MSATGVFGHGAWVRCALTGHVAAGAGLEGTGVWHPGSGRHLRGLRLGAAALPGGHGVGPAAPPHRHPPPRSIHHLLGPLPLLPLDRGQRARTPVPRTAADGSCHPGTHCACLLTAASILAFCTMIRCFLSMPSEAACSCSLSLASMWLVDLASARAWEGLPRPGFPAAPDVEACKLLCDA